MEKLNIPILPIPDVVFFPNTSLPILVAEPTYTKMIRDCVESGMNIGIAMAEPIQTFAHHTKYIPQKIGTIGRPMIVEELKDGTLKVLVRGISRIQLERVEQNIPFPIYQVSLLPDHIEEKPLVNHDRKIERLKSILDHWVSETIPDSIERKSFMEGMDSLHHIVDYLSMFLIKDSEMRQMLLENRSLYDRIQVLSSLFKGPQTLKEDHNTLRAIKTYEYLENTYKVSH